MLVKPNLCRLLLLAGFVFFINVLFAQQRTISGKITDATTLKPLQGSTVAVRGSNVATETNSEGNFTIVVPNDNSKIIISNIGYEPLEVTTAGKDNFSLTLKATTSS